MKVAAENKTGGTGSFTLHHLAHFPVPRGALVLPHPRDLPGVCSVCRSCSHLVVQRPSLPNPRPIPRVPVGFARTRRGRSILGCAVVPNKDNQRDRQPDAVFPGAAQCVEMAAVGRGNSGASRVPCQPWVAACRAAGRWILGDVVRRQQPHYGSGPGSTGAALIGFADDGHNLFGAGENPRRHRSILPGAGAAVHRAYDGAFRECGVGAVRDASDQPIQQTRHGAVRRHIADPPANTGGNTSVYFPVDRTGWSMDRPGAGFGSSGLSVSSRTAGSDEADVPAEIARPGDGISLALIGGETCLASAKAQGRCRCSGSPMPIIDAAPLWRASDRPPNSPPCRPWYPICSIDLPADAQDFQLLNGTSVPTLWVRGRTGPDFCIFAA